MRTKIDDKQLRELVYLSLTRVLKNHKIYYKFRCSVGYGKNALKRDMTTALYCSLGSMHRYVQTARRNGESPFIRTSTKDDVIKVLCSCIDNGKLEDGDYSDAKIQERVTQLVNILIHYCVERLIEDFSVVENIGRETFNMVCKKIFGDDFVDETEKDIPNHIKEMMKLQQLLKSGMGIKDIATNPKLGSLLEEIMGRIPHNHPWVKASNPFADDDFEEEKEEYINDDWYDDTF